MKESDVKDIISNVIWKIAREEGFHILHYNEWVEENWKELKESVIRS